VDTIPKSVLQQSDSIGLKVSKVMLLEVISASVCERERYCFRSSKSNHTIDLKVSPTDKSN